MLTIMYDIATDDAVAFPSRATQAISIAQALTLTHLQWYAHPDFILKILHILVIVGRLQLLLLRHKLLL
jgi:hypothetical protein